MKHIVIVTASLGAGGAERVISQLINKWSNSGTQCSLILLNKSEIFFEVPDNLQLYEIGRQSNNRIADKLKRYKKVRKIIKEIKPDVVLSMPEEIGIYVLFALIGVKVPVFVSERNNPWVMPNKKITRLMRKLMYPRAKGLIFQTQQASKFFSKKLQKKGIVLPNPLDLSRIPEPYNGEREKIIVSAGRLEMQKNFALLINAFEIVYSRHNDYRLVIYGEGRERDKLQQLINEKGLEKVISLPGKSNRLLEEINSATAFALSSDYEGVPNVLIEAMALGMPVVSTDCAPGGAADLITNNENGILVPIGDEKALADGICYIIENSIKAKEMGEKALEIKERLNSELISKKWLDYITN